MATLDDILTTQKNGVIALNNLNKSWQDYVNKTRGQVTSAPISGSTTLLYTGSGYIVRISVLVSGSAGTIYNAISPSGAISDNQIVIIPATVGIFEIGFNFSSGLVISPGSGQTVVVCYTTN